MVGVEEKGLKMRCRFLRMVTLLVLAGSISGCSFWPWTRVDLHLEGLGKGPIADYLRDEYPRIGEWYLKRSLTKLIADWTPAKGLTREDAEKLGMQCAPAPKTECIYSGQVWDRVLPPGIVPKERTVTDIELRFSYLQPQSLVVKVHTHTVVDG
jgi:hypothetical protein